jgi:hypothetical protein
MFFFSSLYDLQAHCSPLYLGSITCDFKKSSKIFREPLSLENLQNSSAAPAWGLNGEASAPQNNTKETRCALQSGQADNIAAAAFGRHGGVSSGIAGGTAAG